MSRRKHRYHEDGRRTPRATNWIWGIFLGVLAGGVVYTVQGNTLGISPSNSGNTSSTESVLPTVGETGDASTTILLAIPMPKADRDQEYAFVWPDKRLKEVPTDKTWRGYAWQLSKLKIIPASPDGKAPILSDGGDWKVPLRTAKGVTLNEPVMVGMADEMHAFVMARATGNQLFLVSRSGDIRDVHDLPDFVNPLYSDDGNAWLASFVPGEGLESDPTGPSRLLRISSDGTEAQVAEETQVIVSIVNGPSNAFAYRKAGGDMAAISGDKQWIGPGLPLAWVDKDHLLLSQGRVLFMLSFPDLKLEQVQILPSEPSLGIKSGI